MYKTGIFLMLAGLLLVADIAFEYTSGTVKALGPGSGRSFKIYTADKKTKMNDFDRLIHYEWIRAILILGAGYICFSTRQKKDSGF